MVRIFYPVLAFAMTAGVLLVQPASAQTPVAGLDPHVDLSASIQAGPGTLQFAGKPTVQLPLNRSIAGDESLFQDEPVTEGGWKGLANLLEALTPDIDTALPLTPSQITGRIADMLNNGQSHEALAIIEKRMAQLEGQQTLGTDVQLMFLHARALAAVGRQSEAITVYRNMTTYYPELPEPWNNLAAEYVKQGRLDMARDALSMALTANPNYATARANMGEVQLMLARQSFEQAADLGLSRAESKAQQADSIIQD